MKEGIEGEDFVVITTGASQVGKLHNRRGLDITKVDALLGREQEKDLALVYRIDQLMLFIGAGEEKTFNAKRKPSDHPVVKALWEAHDNYMESKAGGDQRGAVAWFKELREIQREAQTIRNNALERLFDWKKQAEAAGLGMNDLSQEELIRMAGEA